MAGSKVCRVGDIGVGVCPGHPVPIPFVTVFVSGASGVKVDGRDIAITGTIGVASCGCATFAVSSSSISNVEGVGIHRVGDIGVTSGGGAYVAISGSDITTSE